jgi:hypothetical protein
MKSKLSVLRESFSALKNRVWLKQVQMGLNLQKTTVILLLINRYQQKNSLLNEMDHT